MIARMRGKRGWDMEDKKESERRRLHRQPVDIHGKILRGDDQPESICSIRNISKLGAELRVGADQILPEKFQLVVRFRNQTYDCRQHWRDGKRLGVEFIDQFSRTK